MVGNILKASEASRTLTNLMRINPNGVVKIGTDSISKYEFIE